MNKRHALLFGEIKSAVDSDMDSDDVIRFVCQMLFDGVPHFDWVGVYRCVPEREVLVLGPYSGEETEHEEIPYGSGVCGRVAPLGDRNSSWRMYRPRKITSHAACRCAVRRSCR